jgi:low temperature requirement protein LtrA
MSEEFDDPTTPAAAVRDLVVGAGAPQDAPMATFSNRRRSETSRFLHAPEGQSVAFVELFFDLVFVFAVTQVTSVTARHLDLAQVGRGVLIFWLVWWAWTQFTWTLNPADTTHVVVQVVTLLATASAFVMASSVSLAFGDEALWFAIPYVVVRVLGLGLQVRIAAEEERGTVGGAPRSSRQVMRWVGLSSLGLVAVLAGAFVQPPGRTWIWVLAIALDLLAATIGARSEDPWDIGAAHLAERHGLFVIIALGESLIIAGTAAANESRSLDLVGLAGAGMAVVGLLWWSYFAWFKDDLEAAFEAVAPAHRGAAARDAYSLAHFPLVGGIVGFAIAADLMVLHPADPVEASVIAALGIGTTLFMSATVLSYWRLHRRVLVPRLVITLVTAGALALVVGASPVWPLMIVAVGLLAVAFAERGRLPGGRSVPDPPHA